MATGDLRVLLSEIRADVERIAGASEASVPGDVIDMATHRRR